LDFGADAAEATLISASAARLRVFTELVRLLIFQEPHSTTLLLQAN
jgi:hypothetical protein